MGGTVVGGSWDFWPMFCRSQSTWSNTLVYTPEKENQAGQRLQVQYLVESATWLAVDCQMISLTLILNNWSSRTMCHLACRLVGHSRSLQRTQFPAEPLIRKMHEMKFETETGFIGKASFPDSPMLARKSPPPSHWSWLLWALPQSHHCTSQPPRLPKNKIQI